MTLRWREKLLTLDLRFAEALLPIVSRLANGNDSPDEWWAALKDQPSLDPILQNAFVEEEGRRHLRLEEWRGIWEVAAGRTSDLTPAGRRQQYALANARFAVQNVDVLGKLLHRLHTDLAETTLRVEMTAYGNLPEQAHCAPEIRMVAGTTSGGFVDDIGVYVDIAVLASFGADQKLVEQFLAHELWHSGHWSLIANHPYLDAPWFMPLAQLQSEGLVNFLIGGTYELNSHRSVAGQPEEKERAKQFLAYADSMKAEAASRIDELFQKVGQLVHGDVEAYRQYVSDLPDGPGYLHGRHMAHVIDRALGRKKLLSTCPDPAAFLLSYADACSRLGIEEPPQEALATIRTAATISST